MSMMVLANVAGQVGMPAAVEALRSGADALDVIERGIRPVEADEAVKSVGRGGAPNLLGQVECDAAIMNGIDRNAGTVGALTGTLYAISVARRVMEDLPHVMLVGEGAVRFAAECGVESTEMLTDQTRADYQAWIEKHIPQPVRDNLGNQAIAQYVQPSANYTQAKGTTVFLSIDQNGNLAGGTSTSGWPYKYPGRLGDSPIIGAGLYVHNRYGGCACTHTGEMTIRANTAGSVVRYMQKGATVAEACNEALDDLRELKNGYLGPVIIHAIDSRGDSYVLAIMPEKHVPNFWIWRDGMKAAEPVKPQVAQL